ncbi:MAG: YjjG family noncanonical pyrimidine nucleotidase [Corallococcus sp.]|nr:YjjG family noncanonical pyrimidine nucleotidase [Corallococcus sp.]
MKYSTLLFDIDGTILDFAKSEENALKLTFEHFGFYYSDYTLERYRFNNEIQWHLFEQGKICKSDILTNRFVCTLNEFNIQTDVTVVADYFQERLNEGYFEIDGARQVLETLSKNYSLYIITNGVKRTQESRMRGSGFDKYFIDSFISEIIGSPKPNKKYFDYCLEHIAEKDIKRVLIVGDSLESDIVGSINSNIDTCWFNAQERENTYNVKPTYEIKKLIQLFDIL